MKPSIPFLLAFLVSPCLAQEGNPFVTEAHSGEAVSQEPAGAPFINLVEQILVPPALLDPWLEQHPMKGDASELRAAVQGWIAEGKATLDETGISTSISGRECSNESILERIYATEYEPAQPGEWPSPTAFETRNTGYSSDSNAGIYKGAPAVFAEFNFVRMLQSRSDHPLAEKTREPDDIFVPRFQTLLIRRSEQQNADEDAGGEVTEENPEAASDDSDPFAPGKSKERGLSRQIPFTPGPIHLAARGVDQKDPENKEPQARLVFFRGAIAEKAKASKEVLPENLNISARLIRVDHRAFSDWLQKTGLLSVPSAAWPAVAAWTKEGKAETLTALSGINRVGTVSTLEDMVEVTYPTEWAPGGRETTEEGEAGQEEFPTGTSFETRNTGSSLDARLIENPDGATTMRISLARVILGGHSVHHRIFRDRKWQAAMTFPVFTSNRWASEQPLKRGEWILVGTGADIDANGKFNPASCVLAFLKVE